MTGPAQIIRGDNGPEYISDKLMAWAERMSIHIQYIQPGQPQIGSGLTTTTVPIWG